MVENLINYASEQGLVALFAMILLLFMLKIFMDTIEQNKEDRKIMVEEHKEDRATFKETIVMIADSVKALESAVDSNTQEIRSTSEKLDRVERELSKGK